jgi:hypothetical protein
MPLFVSHHRKVLRASFGAALIAMVGVAGFASKAMAADDEVEDTADTKFFKNLLSNLGLRGDSSPGIEYHERSPLVVPPNINLPPPESANAMAANPAWPKDPDSKRSTATKKKTRMVTTSEGEKESMRQLMPNEMDPASKAKRREADGPPAEQSTGGSLRSEQLSPKQLGHEGFTFGSLFGGRDGKEVKFEKEPERTTLTEPPVGLRTPSSKYSYGTKGKLDPTKEVGKDQAVFGVDK